MSGLFLLGLVVVAILAVPAVRYARRRPERAALALGVAIVALGLIATGVQVGEGIADARVQYAGHLDADEILRQYGPTGRPGDPVPRLERSGLAYLSSAEGVMTQPAAGAAAVISWSLAELAPWLLAAALLALASPLLLAAERGDPFWEGASRRLGTAGLLLLVGIPAIAVIDFAAAEIAATGGAGPVAEPALTLSFTQFLPGLIVLALAGAFRRGAELRDFERHAI